MIHLVLGGARSGKSRFAEQQTLELSVIQEKQAVYIATATAIDPEMDNRIAQHQSDRGDSWQLIECPLFLADTLGELDNNNVYLLDCLTLWLNNQLYAVDEESRDQQAQHLQTEIDKLATSLTSVNADIVIVSNEIGLGVIPMGESTRLYVDYCGWLNQKVAGVSDKVTLVTAGIPLCIKSNNE
jgi:adenosylcobinamide kinase/adenosylcobinamide-phosphate guanylyltransferase